MQNEITFHETKKRGRKAIEVTPLELQTAISLLEGGTSFANRSLLWEAVEDSEWAKKQSPRPLTGPTAMLMAKKHNLTINTPMGQRGRQKGCGPIPNAGRKARNLPDNVASALRKTFPLSMTTANDRPFKAIGKIVNKVISGSLKAAVKLKCLDCTNIQPVEIRNCECIDCPLWSFRPYKA